MDERIPTTTVELTRDEAERVRRAAAIERRTVKGFVAFAAIERADRVLENAPKTEKTPA